MNMLRKIFCLFGLMASLTVISMAQTLTVTSPTESSFIGLTNTIRFNITGATIEVHVEAVATGPLGVQFTVSDDFTPDGVNPINGTLTMNFNQGVPEGAYTIVVTATEPGHTYVPVTINVTLDVTKPKFLQFNPITNTFVRGIVPIRVKVLEPNFKDYRVQVGGQDIPNNTGTVLINDEFTVLWDTTGILLDGSKSINIRLRDQADNEEVRSFDVIVDRVNPASIILQPRTDIRLASRADASVAIDIIDASPNGNSIDVSGIDVVARTTAGAYIGRVSLRSFRNINSTTNRWTGRLKWRTGLPREFKIVVTVIDKAGNSGVPQEVLVRYR
jgi:hypothetical protein